MNDEATIFAPATAVVKSGIAIIRVSGSKAAEALLKLTALPQLPAARRAHYLPLFHPDDHTLLDHALLLWFPAPHSFTGEDIAEFHIHGSLAVIRLLSEVLSNMPSIRLAEPGEFSRRAFYNGKMDLTQAEGLADLIEAETTLQARQAVRQMQGELKQLYDNWRKELITILAWLEAYIDFPDEDIPENIRLQAQATISSLSQQMQKHLDDKQRGERLRQGLYITIIGSPNVGKSSLINTLAQRDIAIVSDIAGTTRDILEVHLDIEGYPVIIADTAGLREQPGNVIEHEGIRRARQHAQQSDLKIIMFEASASKIAEISAITTDNYQNEDKDKVYHLIDEKTIIVINKIDLTQNISSALKIMNKTPILLSLKTGQGIETLLDAIKAEVQQRLSPSQDPVITRTRHRQLIAATITSLQQFSFDKPIELSTEDIRHAAYSLGCITGRINIEEVLDALFEQFCIGK